MSSLILSNVSKGQFAPHPETDGFIKAVIVDVTPPKMMTTKFGDKNVFKLVYETDHVDTNGRAGLMFSVPYSLSLHEKSSFRRDLKAIRGRDLTAAEEKQFDVEAVLLGFPVQIIVMHEAKEDRVYAKISLIKPDKSDAPYKPSGAYVRVKDREEKEAGGTYRTASSAPAVEDEPTGREDWQKVKVHVGKYEGQELGDLPREGVQDLHSKWVPSLHGEKLKAADKRLMAAVAEAMVEMEEETKRTTTMTQGGLF